MRVLQHTCLSCLLMCSPVALWVSLSAGLSGSGSFMKNLRISKPSMDVGTLARDQLVGMLPSWSAEAHDLPMASPHVLYAAASERVAPRNAPCRSRAGSGMYIFCPGFWLESNLASEQQATLNRLRWWGNNTEAISATNCSSRHSLKIHQTTLGSDSPFLSEQECYLLGSSFWDQANYWTNFEEKDKWHPSKTQAR